MVSYKTLFAAGSILIIAALIIAFKPGDDNEEPQPTAEVKPFAVVELFTSEGCSSCPPADGLLGEIVEKARADNQRIFALAFHVDYWNDLGWKDIYSRAEYSQRQRNYARALRSNVYTPQMIVNGETGFVGSNGSRAKSSISNALDKSPGVSVTLGNITYPSKKEVQVNYTVSGEYSNAVLNVAVVERNIVRNIKRGENNGLTLHHENVVRAFETLNLEKAEGAAKLGLPDDVDVSNASVIAYVQNQDSKEIIGAQGKDLK